MKYIVKYIVTLLVLLLAACTSGPQSKVLTETALALATIRFLEKGTPEEVNNKKERLGTLIGQIEDSLGTDKDLNTAEFFISLVGKRLNWSKYSQEDKLVLSVVLQLIRNQVGSGKDVSVLAIREVLLVIKRSLSTS